MSDQKTQTDEIKVEGREVAYRFLTTFEELKKTGQLTRWVDDHDILLYEHDGQIKALSDICRHFGGPVGFHKAKNGEFVSSCTMEILVRGRVLPVAPGFAPPAIRVENYRRLHLH